MLSGTMSGRATMPPPHRPRPAPPRGEAGAGATTFGPMGIPRDKPCARRNRLKKVLGPSSIGVYQPALAGTTICFGAGGCRRFPPDASLAPGGPASHALGMFTVSEEEAAAIRAAFDRGGELAAAVEFRRLFPGISDNEQARQCARTIAGWKPLKLPPRPPARVRKFSKPARATAPDGEACGNSHSAGRSPKPTAGDPLPPMPKATTRP